MGEILRAPFGDGRQGCTQHYRPECHQDHFGAVGIEARLVYLQVFDHARDQLAYDEEFLTAALLHDVGKAIDPTDHVGAGLEALDGFITERTAWLIEYHMHAHQLADGALGARARRRLEQSEHFDDLVLLGECDRAGRQPGVEAPELDEALEYLRELGQMFG